VKRSPWALAALAAIAVTHIFPLMATDSPPPLEFYTKPQLVKLLWKIYADRHADKSEKLVFITADGQTFIFGSGNPNAVSINLPAVIDTLARSGQNLASVTNIVHNHNSRRPKPGFPPGDIAACETLRAAGFGGKFQIFYPVTGRLETLER
jgi:hypothetical protein